MNMLAPVRRRLRDHERGGLPAWTYFSGELLELEKAELFRKTWQLACHVSDVAEPGSYLAFDIVGERALIVRGKDGEVRAFHNVCRHRGSRVVADARGRCKSAIVCPFHGWSYNLDGTLRAVPQARSFPSLDPVEHGLAPLESEIWNGFVFVRFVPGNQPPVADIMADHAAAFAHYRLSGVEPYSPIRAFELPANWKSVRDVDNEGYHVPVAHPALHDLYGNAYADETVGFGVTRSRGTFNDGASRYWSVRNYKKALPNMNHLPEERRRTWYYYGLFPNLVIMLYPDLIGFYQEFPVTVDRTIQRFAYYALPDSRRETRVSRYLGSRIDRITGMEDTQLISWSWEAMQSSGFRGVILSDLESGVRAHHDTLRAVLPVTRLDKAPPEGELLRVNDSMQPPVQFPWGR